MYNNSSTTTKSVFPLFKQRHRAILRSAGYNGTRSNDPNQLETLCKGIFLPDKKMFYWLDKNTSFSDCYMLFASNLNFGDQSYDYWHWKPYQMRNESVQAAELVNPVRWLEARGQFSTVRLQLNTVYQVCFVVKLIGGSKMVGVPLNLSLVLPDGTKSGVQDSVTKIEEWTELVAGKFRHGYNTIGTIYFSLHNVDSRWKVRIVVLGVHIKPVGAGETGLYS